MKNLKLLRLIMPSRTNLMVCLLLLGLSLPAAAQEQLDDAAGLCRSMGPELVMAISTGIFAAVIVTLVVISTVAGRLPMPSPSLPISRFP